MEWKAIIAGIRIEERLQVYDECDCGRKTTRLVTNGKIKICKACATDAINAIDKSYRESFGGDDDI